MPEAAARVPAILKTARSVRRFSRFNSKKGAANDTAGMGSVLSLAWGEDSLSWYVTGWASGGSTSGGTSAEGQLNEKGAHYTYLVLG